MKSTAEAAPALYRHHRGAFYVRLPKWAGGGTRFFGSDPEAAEAAYAQWATEWEAARRSASARKENGGAPIAIRGRANRERMKADDLFPSRKPNRRKALTVKETAAQLFALVDSESGPAGRRGIRDRLRNFLEFAPANEPMPLGNRAIDALEPTDFIAFKGWLVKRYSPEYVCNQLVALRRLLNTAFEIGAIEIPYRLGVLKPVNKGAVKRKGVGPEKVKALIEEVAAHNRPLAIAMLVQVYCVLRPSETPKVLYGRGEEQDYGIAINSKTTRKTGELRAVLIHDETRALIEEFRRTSKGKYGTHNAYRLGVNVVGRAIGDARLMEIIGRKTPLSPHFLRHSANDALRQAKVSDEHVRIAMGRLMPRVERAYGGDNYLAARDAIAILTERIPPKIIG